MLDQGGQFCSDAFANRSPDDQARMRFSSTQKRQVLRAEENQKRYPQCVGLHLRRL
jgi:hypothetical protein